MMEKCDELSYLLQATQTHDAGLRRVAEESVLFLLATEEGVNRIMDYILMETPLHLRQLAILLLRQGISFSGSHVPRYVEKLIHVAFYGVLSGQASIMNSSIPLVTKLFIRCGAEIQAHIFAILRKNLTENGFVNAAICCACISDIFENSSFDIQEHLMINMRDVVMGICEYPFDISSPQRMAGLVGIIRLSKRFFIELGNIKMSIGMDQLGSPDILKSLLHAWPGSALSMLESHKEAFDETTYLNICLPVYIETIRAVTVIVGAFPFEMQSYYDPCINFSCQCLELLKLSPSFKHARCAPHDDGDLYGPEEFVSDLFEMINCVLTVSDRDCQMHNHLTNRDGIAALLMFMVDACQLSFDEWTMWSTQPNAFVADLELDEDEMSCKTRHICAQAIRALCKRLLKEGTVIFIMNDLVERFVHAATRPEVESSRRAQYLESVLWLLQHITASVSKGYMKKVHQCSVHEHERKSYPLPHDDGALLVLRFMQHTLIPFLDTVDITDGLLAGRALYSICQLSGLYPQEYLINSVMRRCIDMMTKSKSIGFQLQGHRSMIVLFKSLPAFNEVAVQIPDVELSQLIEVYVNLLLKMFQWCDKNTICFPVDALHSLLRKISNSSEKDRQNLLNSYNVIVDVSTDLRPILSIETVQIVVNSLLSLWSDLKCDAFLVDSIRVLLRRVVLVILKYRFPLGSFFVGFTSFAKWVLGACSQKADIDRFRVIIEKMRESMIDLYDFVINILISLTREIATHRQLEEFLFATLECIEKFEGKNMALSCGNIMLMLPIELLDVLLGSLQKTSDCINFSEALQSAAVNISGSIAAIALSQPNSTAYLISVKLICRAVILFEKCISDEVFYEAISLLWNALICNVSKEDDDIGYHAYSDVSSSRRHVLITAIVHICVRNSARFIRVLGPSQFNRLSFLEIVREWQEFHSDTLLLLFHNSLYTLKLSTIGLLLLLEYSTSMSDMLDEITISKIFAAIVKSMPVLSKEICSDVHKDASSVGTEGSYYIDGDNDVKFDSDSDMQEFIDDSEASEGPVDEIDGNCTEDIVMNLSDMLGKKYGEKSPAGSNHSNSIFTPKGLDLFLYDNPASQDEFLASHNFRLILRKYVNSITKSYFHGDIALFFERSALARHLSSTDIQVLAALLAFGFLE